MTKTKEPTAEKVMQMLLDACKELMKEHGSRPKGVTDWEVVNDAMCAGADFIHKSEKTGETK